MSAIPSSPSATAGNRPVGDAPDGELGYCAFISYSHADTTWATWLLRRLEGYRVPERFHGRDAPIGKVGARIAPVFRDRDELPTADDLGEAVQKALRRSATLVVICSQTAARSRWVNEEVIQFKRLGRSGRVFALIVAGEPNAKDPAQECFPPALRFTVGAEGVVPEKPVELIAADAREHADGKGDAFIRLVAGMLGVGFDDLRQREMQRRHRRRMWIAIGATAGLAITIGLVSLALVARNDARRRQQNSEEYMAKMLERLKTRLEKADRLDVLDEAGANAMAYFQSLNPRDLTDKTNTQQAKVLTQLGQIRLRQLRFDEAKVAFTEAFTRASALAARHPRDGEMLFERAQAEYWVGNIHRRQGNRAQAREWMVRYRDSGAALLALNSAEPRWQEELAWGHHNLAVLDLERDKLEEARRGFLGELAILARLSDAKPADLSLRDRIVDANSWLGTIAERSGDLREAEARCAEQVTRMEAIVRAEPDNAMRRIWLAEKLGLHASILAIVDQRSVALGCRVRAREMFDALIVGDPKNMELLGRAINCRAREAHLVAFAGDLPRVRQLVQEVRQDKLSAH